VNEFYCEPAKLVNYLRFDIPAKFFYAKNRHVDSSFPTELYRHHLKVWNNCNEITNPRKSNFEAYVEEFDKILESIENTGFNKNTSYVPVYNNTPLNAAHRIAASILYNKNVFCRDSPVQEGQLDCSYNFFKNRNTYVPEGLQTKYADQIALEYCKLKKNTYIVSVFPSAIGQEEEIRRTISKYSNIVYDKRAFLRNYGPYNFIRTLYENEEWLGNYSNKFQGGAYKASLCYNRVDFTRIYLIEADNPNKLIELKNEIRGLFKIGKHSAHINDTHEETLRIARSIFNENSIHFLNNAKPEFMMRFENLFGEYKKWLLNSDFDTDDFCVGGSGTLSAYGLRDCRDIDFLHREKHFGANSSIISCHNKEIHNYNHKKDEIIFNPDNHFYHMTLKFASLDVIKQLKEKRAEPKDIKDVQLLSGVLK